MLSSRRKPGWLMRAKQEVEDLWKQQNELADILETVDDAGPNIQIQLNHVEREIAKAETTYADRYRIWDDYLGLKVRLGAHNPIVAIDQEDFQKVHEAVTNG